MASALKAKLKICSFFPTGRKTGVLRFLFLISTKSRFSSLFRVARLPFLLALYFPFKATYNLLPLCSSI